MKSALINRLLLTAFVIACMALAPALAGKGHAQDGDVNWGHDDDHLRGLGTTTGARSSDDANAGATPRQPDYQGYAGSGRSTSEAARDGDGVNPAGK